MAAAAPPRPAFRIEIAEADVGDLTARPKCSPWRLPYTFSPEPMGGAAQSRAGLHRLLDAASFKFLTSLAGLALSIAYTGFRNYRLRLIEHALDGFNSALERQMPLATPAFLQHEANETLQQSAALQTFGNELAVSIGQAFDSAFGQRF